MEPTAARRGEVPRMCTGGAVPCGGAHAGAARIAWGGGARRAPGSEPCRCCMGSSRSRGKVEMRILVCVPSCEGGGGGLERGCTAAAHHARSHPTRALLPHAGGAPAPTPGLAWRMSSLLSRYALPGCLLGVLIGSPFSVVPFKLPQSTTCNREGAPAVSAALCTPPPCQAHPISAPSAAVRGGCSHAERLQGALICCLTCQQRSLEFHRTSACRPLTSASLSISALSGVRPIVTCAGEARHQGQRGSPRESPAAAPRAAPRPRAAHPLQLLPRHVPAACRRQPPRWHWRRALPARVA